MITITYNQSFIPYDQILSITEKTLLDYYKAIVTPEGDDLNLAYILLATMDKYEREGKRELAARVAYLLSYSLFILLTPPGSAELALRYAEMAFEWNPTKEYEEWIEYVLKGN